MGEASNLLLDSWERLSFLSCKFEVENLVSELRFRVWGCSRWLDLGLFLLALFFPDWLICCCWFLRNFRKVGIKKSYFGNCAKSTIFELLGWVKGSMVSSVKQVVVSLVSWGLILFSVKVFFKAFSTKKDIILDDFQWDILIISTIRRRLFLKRERLFWHCLLISICSFLASCILINSMIEWNQARSQYKAYLRQ